MEPARFSRIFHCGIFRSFPRMRGLRSATMLTSRSIFPLLGLLGCLGSILGTPLSAQNQGKAKKPAQPATIYVIRGGGGYFPNLGTIINEKFEEKGLHVVDYRFHQRSTAAREIAAAYRQGDLPQGIILVGYSLGGCGVIDVSRSLQKEGLPVRYLFLIETINPLQTVPANVQECFNLYHFPALLGAPVRADSPETRLTNYEAYRDAGLGLEYSHFAMPFVEEVHELISSRLLAAIESERGGRDSRPAVKAASGPAPVSPPAPAVKKREAIAEEVPASERVEPKSTFLTKLLGKTQAATAAEGGEAAASPRSSRPVRAARRR